MAKKNKGGTNRQVKFVVQSIPQRSKLLNYKFVANYYRYYGKHSRLIWMMLGLHYLADD